MKVIKMELESEHIDKIAKPEDLVEVEISKEVGFKDKYKLYINYNGQFILRICKLNLDQLFIKCLREDIQLIRDKI